MVKNLKVPIKIRIKSVKNINNNYYYFTSISSYYEDTINQWQYLSHLSSVYRYFAYRDQLNADDIVCH